MRVLTIVEDLGMAGTQRNAQNFAVAYRTKGHESAVLAFRRGGPRAAELAAHGVTVFAPSGEEPASTIAEAASWRADLLHIHRPGPAWADAGRVLRALGAGTAGGPRVVETNVFARVDYSADRELFDVHGQISRWCLWKWRRWAQGIEPAPIGVLVPYLVDDRSFYKPEAAAGTAFRRRFGIPDDALVIGRVGSPSMSKWSTLILTAFAEFAADRPDAWLLGVGFPPELEAMRTRMPEPVRRRIVSAPLQQGDENLRNCYGSMDIFLHAAQIGESFGMVLCEAMLCGVPVITLSTPAKDNSQVEVVGHDRGGLIAAHKNGMVAAMRSLADDAPRRARLAAQGASWVRSQYGPDRIGRLLDRVARIVVSEPDRGSLRARLDADPELTTMVPDSEIRSLLKDSVGATTLRDRLLMRTVMVPGIYRVYHALATRYRAMKSGRAGKPAA